MKTHHTSIMTPLFRGSRNLFVFSMLLALLVMGGCENISPDSLGVNDVLYSVKGTVSDVNGNPIQNLAVSLWGVLSNEEGQTKAVPMQGNSVKTDEKGAYLLTVYGHSFTVVQVSVMDVDGIANDGEFLSDSLRIRIFDFQKDKKLGWTADIAAPDIKLKKK